MFPFFCETYIYRYDLFDSLKYIGLSKIHYSGKYINEYILINCRCIMAKEQLTAAKCRLGNLRVDSANIMS